MINFVIFIISSYFLLLCFTFFKTWYHILPIFRLSQHLILCYLIQVPLLLDLVSKLLFLTSCTFTQTLAWFLYRVKFKNLSKKFSSLTSLTSSVFGLFWLFQTKGIIFVKIECNITQPINELSLNEALEQSLSFHTTLSIFYKQRFEWKTGWVFSNFYSRCLALLIFHP